ncbi:dephospho-CoA kinase [Leucobacter sp. W1153]|uniref:dephospho-CoA kinase n=1 Tax=Leucobacter sp. W1153 TaxID=3439064 RepID=UPI003F2B80E8
MKLIALTGGIAAGKSTIARRLAEHGAVHIDADQLAREAVAPDTPALSQIVDRFGPHVLSADGTLDRPALGRIVFGDQDALAALNAIVHPAVRELTAQRVAAAEASDPNAVVVYDVPLLAEGGAAIPFDLVVVAEAHPEVRLKRLITLRGMAREEADARIASQASNQQRRAIADVIIDTGGAEAETLAQADELWIRLSGESPRSE